MTDDDDYDAWARSVPPQLTEDPVWRTPAYRYSLFLAKRSQLDLHALSAHPATRPNADQLLRSVASISANLTEGYSRSTGPERAHFYEYALCSAREARDWYYKCEVALPAAVVSARMTRLTRIIRILTAIIPRERNVRLSGRKRGKAKTPDRQGGPASSKEH